MRRELLQKAVYSAAEAERLSFRERLHKRRNQGLFKCLGKAAVGSITKSLIDVPRIIRLSDARYEIIGGGYENIVYASSDEVLKVNVRTLAKDKEEVTDEAQKRQLDFNLCAEYLGPHWLQTDYLTTDFMNAYAVGAIQQRLHPAKSFDSVEEMVAYRDDPEYTAQLESLFTAVTDLYQKTSYYPDLLGPNNIHLMDDMGGPKLIITDTQPASPETQQKLIPNTNQQIQSAIEHKVRRIKDVLLRS